MILLSQKELVPTTQFSKIFNSNHSLYKSCITVPHIIQTKTQINDNTIKPLTINLSNKTVKESEKLRLKVEGGSTKLTLKDLGAGATTSGHCALI